MIDSILENLADGIREVMEERVPVDPMRIATDEGIILAPGDFGEDFSGRIEYHSNKRVFLLFYPQKGDTNRIRFSIGHELGHYYIDDHRILLTSGESHNSNAGFICEEKFEREADLFAAALLIPRNYIDIQTQSRGFMTLESVLQMASYCKTSATCAAIRYAQYATEACAAVLSSGGKVTFGISSDEMGALGLKFIKRGTFVPLESPTAKCATNPRVGQIVDGRSQSLGWFANRFKNLDLWEEAIPLGYSGQILTLLATNEDADDSND